MRGLSGGADLGRAGAAGWLSAKGTGCSLDAIGCEPEPRLPDTTPP